MSLPAPATADGGVGCNQRQARGNLRNDRDELVRALAASTGVTSTPGSVREGCPDGPARDAAAEDCSVTGGTAMTIDLQAAIRTSEELLTELRRLDGVELVEAQGRAARHQRGQHTRKLLYLAHVCDRARVQVMDAYFAFKEADQPGEQEPDER